MKRLLLFAALGVAALFAAATDRFYIEDFNITPGETCTVSILLDNEAEYTAFQSDIYLPDGLTATNFALTSRKNATHTLTATPFPDNVTRLLSYSLNVKPYKGNSGALVTFDVTAGDGFGGNGVIVLRHTLFTTTSGVEVAFADETCNVTAGRLGDMNGDGVVNVSDVTLLVNMILNNNDLEATQYPYADMNGDGAINISDLTILIGNILNND